MVSAVHQVTWVGECYQYHWGHSVFIPEFVLLIPFVTKLKGGKNKMQAFLLND